MHIKTIVSAIALSATLGFGGVVYAQDAALPTMIGEQQLTEADAQRVKVHCEDLQTSENQAVGATDAEQELTETDDGSGTDDTASSTDDGDSDSAAVGSIDMSAITLEACLEAGFVTAP